MRVLFAVFLTVLGSITLAQTSSQQCIDCHSDETMTMEKNGKEISLFVSQDAFKNSVHGATECIDCHTGFDAESLPHKEGNNISRVDCAQCHDTETFAASIHAAKKISCYSCHSKHDIQPAEDLQKAEVDLCVKCHKSTSVKSFTKSIHYKGFIAGKEAPLCTDCHNNSAHAITAANFTKDQEAQLCASCHKNIHDDFAQSIHKLASDNNAPGCVSCHGAHDVFNNKYSISSQSCLKCHMNKTNFQGKENLVSFVHEYQTSVHGRIGENNKEAATCVDCHDNHLVVGTEVTRSKTARKNIPNTCGKCHSQVVKDFSKSTHGVSFIGGSELAPNCIDCHGEHSIGKVEKSPTNKLAVEETCIQCHINNKEVIRKTGIPSEELLKYEESAHFKALRAGNENAATCSDCHGSHLMQASNITSSKIKRENIANTCGTGSNCHPAVSLEYKESIHADAVKKGIMDAPTCVDCHGNHQIFGEKDQKGFVKKGQNIVLLCSSCHAGVEMSEKYNIPAERIESYNESYHGLAVRGGSKYAADCASCHGAHDIKPSSDPNSSIHKNNLSETCGSCHPGANITAEFTKVHLTGAKEESALLYWITQIYIVLIVLIIGGMLVHNILDYIRKRQEKKHHKKEIAELKKQGKVYLRMTRNERIQHFIMLTSFITLVITGFALKYPEAWWVVPFRNVLGDWAFQTRSLVHRIFGIAMVLISLYHLYYLLFTRTGRKLLFDFLPNLQDLKDLLINVKYLIGVSKEKPRFGRFSYMEKAEYWALVWGVIIMSATGLMLMFNNLFLSTAPKILLDAATLVHLYEAWLASLAIVVWHFYFVIFNPEVYPLNTAFITGTMSEEVMREEHPLELEKLNNENGENSEILVKKEVDQTDNK